MSGYTVRDEVRYAAIWEKTNDSTAWTARIHLSSAEFLEEFNLRIRQGYRLTDISGYAVGDEDNYAAIWEQKGGPAWTARYDMTLEVFQSEFDKALAQRYVLKVLNGYTVAGSDRYAAIWEHVPDTAILCQKD